MGARHQLFVVARIGARYRVLAALHHQWLEGESVLRACLQILKILRANAPMVRQELLHAEKFDWESSATKEHRRFSRKELLAMTREQRAAYFKAEKLRETLQDQEKLDFPMITTCLMIGAAKRGHTFNRVHIPPRTISFNECDNNEGFTVFDVTSPNCPRYCFMEKNEYENETEDEDEDGDDFTTFAMDARDYLLSYLTRCDGEEDESGTEDEPATEDEEETATSLAKWQQSHLESCAEIEELTQFPLVDLHVLCSAWPAETFAHSTLGFPVEHEDHKPKSATLDQGSSLRSLAMHDVILQAATTSIEDPSRFLEAQLLLGFNEKALEYLNANPELVTTTSGLDLLCRVLQGSQEIDLTHFSQLKKEHVLRITSELRHSTQPVSLSLPPLDDLTAADVCLLASATHIGELRFGTTEGLGLDLLLPAMSGARFQVLSHPELHKTALAALNGRPGDTSMLAKTSVAKLVNDHPICQAICLGTVISPDDPQIPRSQSGTPAWAKHLAAILLDKQDYLGSSPIGGLQVPYTNHILPIPLLDVPLATERLLPRLYKAVASQTVGGSTLPSYSDVGASLAMSLAMDECQRVSPLPAALLGSYESTGSCNIEPQPKANDVIHGEWTLVVCHERIETRRFEHKSSAVRHCFVSKNAEGQLIYRTLEQFLELAVPNSAAALRPVDLEASFKEEQPWGTKVEEVGPCDPVEAEEAVKAAEMYNAAIDARYVGRLGEMLASYRKHH